MYDTLQRLISQKLNLAELSIYHMKNQNKEAANRHVQDGEGRIVMDKIRQIIYSFEDKDIKKLHESNDSRQKAANNLVLTILVIGSDSGAIREMALLMQEVYAELTGEVVLTDLIDIDGEKFYGSGYEDHTRVVADISKLGSLGWEPTRGLKETLRSVMGWYLDNKEEMVASIGAATS